MAGIDLLTGPQHSTPSLCLRELCSPGLLPLADLFDAMSEGAVTIRTKKFITNRLLQRKQFVRRALMHSTLSSVV